MGGISVAADKSRANLKVIVQDEETKQPIRCWVEIWAHYPQTELPKGEHTFKNMSLTSGTPGKDFVDGWAIKIFSGPDGAPDAKIFKWPDVDTVLKPEGGKTHTKVCLVKGPRAALKVEVRKQDGSAFTDGATVIVGGAPRGKTDKSGDLLVKDAPVGDTTIRIQAKGWAEVPEGSTKTSPADEVVRAVKVDAGGGTTAKFSLFAFEKPKGIGGRLAGTHGVRKPVLTRAENVLPTRETTETDFFASAPVVLMRGCGTLTLEAYGSADVGGKALSAVRCQGMTWDVKRREGTSGPVPVKVTKDGGQRLELAGDVGGAFNVTATRAGMDKPLSWNVVFVTLEVQSSQATPMNINFADDPDKKDKDGFRVGFRSGRFKFPPAEAAWYARANVKLTGWDGKSGLDEIEVRILQNGIGDDLTGKYDEGHTGLEVPRGGLPIVDCNPARQDNGQFVKPGPPAGTYGSIGPWADLAPAPAFASEAKSFPHSNTVPPFIWTDTSFKIDSQTAEVRSVETLDSPAGAFHTKHFHSKEKLRRIEGGITFKTAIATFSRHAPNTILVHATLVWRVNFTGNVEHPFIGNAKYVPDGPKVTSDVGYAPFVPSDPGLGVDAAKAGFETVEPRFNGACQIFWVPGGMSD